MSYYDSSTKMWQLRKYSIPTTRSGCQITIPKRKILTVLTIILATLGSQEMTTDQFTQCKQAKGIEPHIHVCTHLSCPTLKKRRDNYQLSFTSYSSLVAIDHRMKLTWLTVGPNLFLLYEYPKLISIISQLLSCIHDIGANILLVMQLNKNSASIGSFLVKIIADHLYNLLWIQRTLACKEGIVLYSMCVHLSVAQQPL